MTHYHLGCLLKHAIKMVSAQENTNVAIIINAVLMPNVSLTATLLNLVSVLQDSSLLITIVWILMNVNLEHMNVEHQSVLTYKDRIVAQLLLMWSGPSMEPDRTREMSQQQKVIFKNKSIISNRRGIKAREKRIFRNILIRDFVFVREEQAFSPWIPCIGLEFRMGLTFWSDRTFQSNEMNDNQYHCALPLTSISKITTSMINKAFSSIGKMYGGGDAEEDVLLGKFLKDSGQINC